MKYLIEIAVGPVQEFIASARKLRDLWFGSTLLSELSKSVAKSLHAQGCALIFPAPQTPADLTFRSSLIVANKILAEYDGEDPRKIVATARAAWKDLIKKVSEETLQAIDANPRFKAMKVNTELFWAQIGDFGEFFAAWVPVTSNGGDYGALRHCVEKLLAGRKNLREFQPPSWKGYGLPKNSLDGMRETVIGNKNAHIPGLLKSNEKLDAIGLVKRFWPLNNRRMVKRFSDLAAISSSSWFAQINANPEAKSLIQQFSELFDDDDDYPVEAIYEESTDDATWQNEYGCRDPRLARTLLKKLRAAVGAPQKYSCVLRGDGDNMGAAIDKINTLEGFRNFTADLSSYAAKVEKIINDNHGGLIYAGGDDILAFVPIGSALQCADALRQEFAKTMKPICEAQGIDRVPTLSIGMTVVHYSEPLSNALLLASKAEGTAKNEGGKDAMAIIQSKRSGSPLTVHGKWERQGDLPGIVDRLKRMVALYRAARGGEDDDSVLSAHLGYQLRTVRVEAGDELIFTKDATGKKLCPGNAQSALVLRIFHHKDGVNDEDINELLSGRTSVRMISNELVIANQLAGAGDDK